MERRINGDCLCSNRATDERRSMIEKPSSITRRPVARSDGGIYMTVMWKEPKNKNRANITGYDIKYGSKSEHDNDYHTQHVNKKTTKFQFTDQLNEETSYRFAVAAVNATGRGKFSKYTKFVRTKSGEQCCDYHCSFRTFTYFFCFAEYLRPLSTRMLTYRLL